VNKGLGLIMGICLVGSVLADAKRPPVVSSSKPNFVVIFTDDQGYADLSCFGGTHVHTPRIDQMATEGARLTSFYVAAPLCTPSRAALLTGCYPKRVGMATGSNFGVLLAGDTKGLNPKETTIAEMLKTAGYKTGMFGKWHLGDQPEFLPTRQGFDEYFGIPYSHDIHSFHPSQEKFNFPLLPLLDGETVIEMEPDADYLTKRITERAISFIEANKGGPFFLYVPHPIPHRPLHASPPFMKDVAEPLKAKLAAESQNHNIDYDARDKIFAQAISEIDWSVGQILDALKKQGLDDNTLVIFTSDNGPAVGLATPLRGKKGSTFEGGMREPTVIRWPGKIPAGTVNDELMTTMDLLPTFAKLAGAEMPSDRVIDGKDIWPVLTGNGKSPHEAFFYHSGNTLEAVRSGQWKLHLAAQGKTKGKDKKKGKGAASPMLYNLEQDIGETTDVSKDNPKVVARLCEYIAAFEKDLAENSRPAAFVDNPKPLSTATGLAATPPPVVSSSKPNVVFFFADDLGYGDLGCYGATKVQTPNIDKLAAEGRKFSDAHSASAVCTPSRYALITGEYPLRADGGKGVWGPLGSSKGLIIDTNTLTIAKAFKNKGYATAALGKWHLGFGEGKNDWSVPLRPGPQDIGFDYYFGVPLVNSGSPFVYVENDTIVGYDPADPLIPGGKPPSPTPTFPEEASKKSDNKFGGALKAHQIYDDEKTGTLLTEKAVKWITENKDKPFFLYFPTTNIHHPFTPAPRFKGTSQCGLYGDFIHELDWMVGEVLKCLEENNLRDNTLVIFTSDNGGMLNLAARNAWGDGHRQNGDLLGFKFGAWEGGHRVPFIARWPGKIAAGTESKQLICNVDMLATFMALTGQDPNSLKNKDSINVLPALLGDPTGPLRTELILAPFKSPNLSIRKGKWMHIGAQGSGGFTGSKPSDHAWGGAPAAAFAGSKNSDIENGKIKPGAPPAQLYDLDADLFQTKNLYREYPEVVKELSALLATYAPPKSAPEQKKRSNRKKKQ
jgi:arylsulfatase A